MRAWHCTYGGRSTALYFALSKPSSLPPLPQSPVRLPYRYCESQCDSQPVVGSDDAHLALAKSRGGSSVGSEPPNFGGWAKDQTLGAVGRRDSAAESYHRRPSSNLVVASRSKDRRPPLTHALGSWLLSLTVAFYTHRPRWPPPGFYDCEHTTSATRDFGPNAAQLT